MTYLSARSNFVNDAFLWEKVDFSETIATCLFVRLIWCFSASKQLWSCRDVTSSFVGLLPDIEMK